MTHAELVQIAGRWLRNTLRCGVVLLEKPAFSGEIPDAVGWKGPAYAAECILVECKVSRADFLADMKKPHRMHPASLGRRRWYMTDGHLVLPEEVPGDWGLVEFNGRTCRVKKLSGVRPTDELTLDYERKTLLTELRKYQAQGITYKPATQVRP